MTKEKAKKHLESIAANDPENKDRGQYTANDLIKHAEDFLDSGEWSDGSELTNDDIDALESFV